MSDQRESMEKNRDILKAAIIDLPRYNPDSDTWSKIEMELDQAERDMPLHEAINRLPLQTPPLNVWSQIESDLDSGSGGALIKSLQARTANRWQKWAGIAAGIALLTVFSLNIWNPNHHQESIAYSTATLEQTIDLDDYQADDLIFSEVIQSFRTHPVAQAMIEYDEWLFELSEINVARDELIDVMEHYGSDDMLVNELNALEEERTDLIKKMAKAI